MEVKQKFEPIVFVGYYKSYSLRFLQEFLVDIKLFDYENAADGLLVKTMFSMN